MTDTDEIARTIEPALAAMGYRMVRVAITGGRRATLQVMAERFDDAAMTVDDCADISRAISPLLDVADPIAGAYMLEVSSPGVDRPLVRIEDYDRFAGLEARIELARPRDGRKRFRGRIAGRVGDTVHLATDTGDIGILFADILRAKLVITDGLLGARRSARAAPETAASNAAPSPNP